METTGVLLATVAAAASGWICVALMVRAARELRETRLRRSNTLVNPSSPLPPAPPDPPPTSAYPSAFDLRGRAQPLHESTYREPAAVSLERRVEALEEQLADARRLAWRSYVAIGVWLSGLLR